jgi:hypothetical protein
VKCYCHGFAAEYDCSIVGSGTELPHRPSISVVERPGMGLEGCRLLANHRCSIGTVFFRYGALEPRPRPSQHPGPRKRINLAFKKLEMKNAAFIFSTVHREVRDVGFDVLSRHSKY